MAMAEKGTRWIVVDGVRYGWRAAYDPWYWQEKCAWGHDAPVRVVVQAAGGGPCLVAEFVSGPGHRLAALREPFRPVFTRKLIVAGLAKGWEPGGTGSKPVLLDQAEVVAAVAEPNAAPDDSGGI